MRLDLLKMELKIKSKIQKSFKKSTIKGQFQVRKKETNKSLLQQEKLNIGNQNITVNSIRIPHSAQNLRLDD